MKSNYSQGLMSSMRQVKSGQALQHSLTAHILQDPLNPFPWYRVMRAQAPVYYSPEFKSWFIARYSDVQRVIGDPLLFSSEQSIRSRPARGDQPHSKGLLWTDPPRHRELRSLISQAFTPRTITNLAPRVTEIVHEHLDRMAAQESSDVIQELAAPLPVIVIAELLGVPIKDQQQFKHWSDIIVSPARQEKKLAIQEMNAYFLRIIAQHRQEPREDLISALVQAHIGGIHLADSEVLSFCRLLLVAGHETSTNLIGNALLTLDEHPHIREEIQSNPQLLPATIDEVLRYRSPIQRLRRAATRDVEMEDCLIKAGDIVSPIIGSANRDETQFTRPEEFDIYRPAGQRHIAFGHGIHYCIGSALARLETGITLEAILTRFPGLRRADTEPLQQVASAFVYGIKHFRLRFR